MVLGRLAWRNLWRNWRRTTIALAAIALGVMLLLLMDGLIQGSDQAIFGNAVRLYGGNVLVHAPGYRDRASHMPLLPLSDPDAVVAASEDLQGVVSANRRIATSGLAAKRGASHAVVITGVEPSKEAKTSIVAERVDQGRFLLDGEGDAIVIGRGLADLLQVGVGDEFSLLGRAEGESMHQRSMTVVGVFDLGMPEAEEGMVFITLPEAQDLLRMRDEVTEVAVVLPKVGQEQALIETLSAELPDLEVDSWVSLRPEIRETLDAKSTFSGIFGVIVVLIAAIGILNVLLMAVFERSREMGVLAALGMRRRQILTLFVLEGAMLGVVGAVAGCLLGVMTAALLAYVGIDLSYAQGMGEITALLGTRLEPYLTFANVLKRGVLVIGIAAVAALYPAWVASRKPPAAVLHHV